MPNTLSIYNIMPPEFLLVLIIIVLIFAGIIYFLIKKNNKLKEKSKAVYLEQQQFIRKERQRISGEIHDDIGSGLFSIQLFADLASKKRTDIAELKQISGMVNEMSEKINEIIWSTNTESDNLENLLYYIEHQTIKLFEYTEINYEPNFPMDVDNLIINSQSRRNIYLLVKEIVYNAIKHAKATNVYLNATISNGLLIFEIKDNGVGFNPGEVRQNARGLKNIKARIQSLNGNLVVENYKGTIVMVKIPLNKALASTYAG
ncbi:MAG: ATP-binding protein [Bacteroidota bacterium]|uniref:histidine kinase n=2 Tax=Pedobacter cryotolerans TaxID=2571270 RepID=A0A4U1C2Z2_9SPHI|nr:hypothetical protein FA045_12050 [Pedobacter cryotolerans]